MDHDIDLISISGHKFGGPIGAAALIYREKINLKPLIIGGGQERGVRAGTENIAAIAGMGIAAKCYSKFAPFNSKIRDLFEEKITELYRDLVIFSNKVERLPNTSMIAMPNMSASKQLIAFDMNKVAVSSGSACSSGKVKSSHVLKAMRVDNDLASCAVRISFGKNSTEEDVLKLIEACNKIWKNNG
jgi:cysteine desulfurase